MIFTYCLSILLLRVTSCADTTKSYSSMPSICPNACYCDDNGEYVSCVGDGLWRFPMEVPNTTIRLELRNYLVQELNSDDFANLPEMEELKLQQSKIEIVNNNTFASNTKLQRLDLSQNILFSLSSSVFANLRNLRHLDLSSNILEFVEEAFSELINLEQLNLRENRLQQLTTSTFTGLHKVQYLNLDANNISSIEVGTFQYLTNLAHLIISNNPLTTLSRLDFFGSRLQYIDISHVGLDRIPQSLTKFVRDLRLAKNNLTIISAGDFDSYPYLGLLVLDDNCVSEIENDALGRQEYLMRLWLNGNCLTKVPPNLPPSLLALYMEENKLTELLSYSFKGLVHLEQLFLQRNEIKYMASCVFCDLISLKSLDLQANQIENLTAGVFYNLTNLQTLDLSQNNLMYFDFRCFQSVTHLSTLQMSRVHTNVELPETVFDPLKHLKTLEVYDSSTMVHSIINSTRMLHGLYTVEELNIMHNRIVALRTDFPSFFPSLKVIKLSGNSWHCDETIKWLTNWIKQSNVQFYSSYNIRCASPRSILFKPLMMLTDKDFEITTEIESTIPSQTVESTSSPVTSLRVSPEKELPNNESVTNLAYYNTVETTTVEKTSLNVTEVLKDKNKQVENGDMVTHPYQYKFISNDNQSKKPQHLNNKSNKNESYNSENGNFSQKLPLLTTVISSKSPHKSLLTTHATEVFSDKLYTLEYQKSINDTSGEDYFQNGSVPESLSPQRRVLSSRLRLASQTSHVYGWNQRTMMVVSGVLSGGCIFFVVIALTAFTIFRLRHRYQPVKHRNMRRSSSISYYPQKDEVSIVTLTEGTVGHKTSSYHGLGNKLYYIMGNGRNTPEVNTDAPPDSQLQELLPQSPKDATHLY